MTAGTNNERTLTLYRPVGLNELQLIYEAGMRAFPPRLHEQPIFYPVLNREYARQIARDWNTKSRSYAGYVTRFAVDEAYVSRFEPHIVGSRVHEELWVPAEELAEFNRHIVGAIEVVEAYFGREFHGYVPDRTLMKDLDAVEQFLLLAELLDQNRSAFQEALRSNHLAVFLHYPFWQQHDFGMYGVDSSRRHEILLAIRDERDRALPEIPMYQKAEGS